MGCRRHDVGMATGWQGFPREKTLDGRSGGFNDHLLQRGSDSLCNFCAISGCMKPRTPDSVGMKDKGQQSVNDCPML